MPKLSFKDKCILILVIIFAITSVFYISGEDRYSRIIIILLQIISLSMIWSLKNEVESIIRR